MTYQVLKSRIHEKWWINKSKQMYQFLSNPGSHNSKRKNNFREILFVTIQFWLSSSEGDAFP